MPCMTTDWPLENLKVWLRNQRLRFRGDKPELSSERREVCPTMKCTSVLLQLAFLGLCKLKKRKKGGK